jgi:hypothetical protein
MAERHTVDVDVVGSKPIRLPKKETPFGGSFLIVALPFLSGYASRKWNTGATIPLIRSQCHDAKDENDSPRNAIDPCHVRGGQSVAHPADAEAEG